MPNTGDENVHDENDCEIVPCLRRVVEKNLEQESSSRLLDCRPRLALSLTFYSLI